METNQRELKRNEILGGYDRTEYISERIMATAERRYPNSYIYRLQTGMEKNGKTPLLLTGYGSYGMNYPASFSSTDFRCLTVGIAIALAHIRGGGNGAQVVGMVNYCIKKNTFSDFIACAEHRSKMDSERAWLFPVAVQVAY